VLDLLIAVHIARNAAPTSRTGPAGNRNFR
jgi:hypothetical protein